MLKNNKTTNLLSISLLGEIWNYWHQMTICVNSVIEEQVMEQQVKYDTETTKESK